MKRSNGDGYIKKLPSGSWRGQIMLGYKPNGKKNMVSVTAPTRAEVQFKLRQIQMGIDISEENRQPDQPKKDPFDAWAETWYADYRTQVQASTYANYRYTLNLLKRHFGSKPIQDIQLMDINAYLTTLHEQGASISQISKCKAMLMQIMGYAEDNEKIHKNPAARAKIIRNTGNSAEKTKDAFSDDEFCRLMEELPDDLTGNSIRTLLVSGMRVQEILALTPEDIAEDGSTIRVNKAIKMVNGIPTLGVPKSKRSNRTIPIPEDYRDIVRYIRENGGKALIWCSNRSDLLCSVQHFRKKYYAALNEISGVRKLPPHCCRHTYITRLEARGVPFQLIAKLAGHSNMGTTLGYTHTDLATLSDAVSALNRKDDTTQSVKEE